MFELVYFFSFLLIYMFSFLYRVICFVLSLLMLVIAYIYNLNILYALILFITLFALRLQQKGFKDEIL